jgi:CubicO group peptidase (beta-lactamase class C family)
MAALGLLGALARAGGVPVTGRPVAELAWADTLMTNYMDSRGITGGLLAIMRNGCVIYQRGFGWHDEAESTNMPENALVRIASCTKPITAAAIRQLIADGQFALGDDAFDVGQSGGGVLNVAPWPSLGDSRIDDITIDNLLRHRGGWDRDIVGDWTYRECDIADDMSVDSPPGRTRTMNWILGNALQFSPGSQYQYSNIGYLALGLIVEQETGLSHITYLRQNVLTPTMWVPSVNFRQGRTFKSDQPAREAYYSAGSDTCVFDSVCGPCGLVFVDAPYGSWDHEARIGQGGIVLSPETMLEFLSRYRVGITSSIGQPLDPNNLVDESHNGALRGVNSLAWQRSDGVNVFIWFNEDPSEGHHGENMKDQLDPLLDAQANWPTLCVDGFWVAPLLAPYRYFGSYNSEFNGVANALAETTDGSKLNFKPGNFLWTGTIDEKTLLRAPLGVARIGTGFVNTTTASDADQGANLDPELSQ